MTRQPRTDTVRRLDDIDLFRGWCVLWMLAVHVALTMPPFVTGFIYMYDCVAESFVFLAGFMAGFHYLPRFRRNPVAVTRHLWVRAGQILLLHYAITLYVRLHLTFVRGEVYDGGVWQFVWDTLTLRYQDFLADILPMFVVFMALAPLGMWLIVRGLWPLLAAASLGLFAYGQWHPWSLSVRPMAAFPAILWQLYFVAGAGWGILRYRNIALTQPRRPWRALGLTWLAWFILLLVPWLVFYATGHWLLTGVLWPNKWPLNIGRVLLLAPMMLFMYYLFQGLARRRTPLPGSGALMLVGRHSLFAYTVHALLVYWWNDAAFSDLIPMVVRPVLLAGMMALVVGATIVWHRLRTPASAATAA